MGTRITVLLHCGWYLRGTRRLKGRVTFFKKAPLVGWELCIEHSCGRWDARSPGVRDELHTSASDRLSCCVTEETLVTCLLISTVSTQNVQYIPTIISSSFCDEWIIISMKFKGSTLVWSSAVWWILGFVSFCIPHLKMWSHEVPTSWTPHVLRGEGYLLFAGFMFSPYSLHTQAERHAAGPCSDQ